MAAVEGSAHFSLVWVGPNRLFDELGNPSVTPRAARVVSPCLVSRLFVDLSRIPDSNIECALQVLCKRDGKPDSLLDTVPMTTGKIRSLSLQIEVQGPGGTQMTHLIPIGSVESCQTGRRYLIVVAGFSGTHGGQFAARCMDETGEVPAALSSAGWPCEGPLTGRSNDALFAAIVAISGLIRTIRAERSLVPATSERVSALVERMRGISEQLGANGIERPVAQRINDIMLRVMLVEHATLCLAEDGLSQMRAVRERLFFAVMSDSSGVAEDIALGVAQGCRLS